MITLDAATVLLQWAVGGLFFLWVTTRRREVGIGYGWLMRAVFGLMDWCSTRCRSGRWRLPVWCWPPASPSWPRLSGGVPV